MAPAGTQSGAGISTLIMVYLRGASDYVQLGGWQNTGGAANTFSGGINQASYMEVLWVSE